MRTYPLQGMLKAPNNNAIIIITPAIAVLPTGALAFEEFLPTGYPFSSPGLSAAQCG